MKYKVGDFVLVGEHSWESKLAEVIRIRGRDILTVRFRDGSQKALVERLIDRLIVPTEARRAFKQSGYVLDWAAWVIGQRFLIKRGSDAFPVWFQSRNEDYHGYKVGGHDYKDMRDYLSSIATAFLFVIVTPDNRGIIDSKWVFDDNSRKQAYSRRQSRGINTLLRNIIDGPPGKKQLMMV